ncbi:M48 family metalloprotease [Polaromonas sp.]|uniref:M48 family metalloprotease n=1 Tax=Polaromonas sp. TaxID=1869339 RepID=UPI001D999D25|nr:M48 family metalloprotease [Polaromonas sp.]MBT9474247.1 M48 family metalloprotease [Polaromonas sp.]
MAPAQACLAQSATAAPPSMSGALPSMGDSSELPAAAERRMGDRIAASIYRDPDYVDDPVLGDYLQSIWQPLMKAARARGELQDELDERFAWALFLIRDRSINAFALPGGYLGVHLGLIGAVNTPDELAAVLAHELSHVTQRHISRLMTQQNRQAPWMIAAMILGALAASKSPDAATAAIVGGQAVAAQGQLNFSRDMEREADRIGFGVMQGAGFDSRGVAEMFEKLQQASRLNDNGAFPYLRSHPLNTQRIAEAQSRLQLAAAATPSPEGRADADRAQLLHAMMAARARVLAVPGVDALRAMLAEAQRRTDPPATAAARIRDAGVLYGGALAAAQLRDFAGARSLWRQLPPLTEGVVRARQAVELLGIEIDLLAGVVPPSAATADLAQATTRAEVLTVSRSLTAARRGREVSDRLQTWVTAHPGDAMAWQMLAVAYGQQNQTVRAIRADAESRVAQRDYPAALDRFKAAQAMMRSQPGSADHVEGSIIDTRARQVESLVKAQALEDKVNR